MAGSVSKVCERCKAEFSRPMGTSSGQWNSRRFCSRACAASKIKISPDAVVGLYRRGKSSPQIAQAIGISAVHVRRILRSKGEPLRTIRDAVLLSHNTPQFKEAQSKRGSGRKHREETKEKLRCRIGANHPLWKGGITKSSQGYLVFTASRANRQSAGKALHRVIAETECGRSLQSKEHVHHKDGDKMNNHSENLQILSASEHARLHAIKSGFGRKKNA